MGIFDGVFNTQPQQQAAGAQIAGITQGANTATNYFNQGINSLNTDYTAGMQPYLWNINQGKAGTTAYGNATGANGPQGTAAATQAFWSNPGTSAQLRMGDAALTAQNAASGNTNSGNEAIALDNYNTGVVGQGWNNYVSSLAPYLNFNTANTAGYGSLNAGLGTQVNQSQENLGNLLYGADTSIGNANANADLAKSGANANILSAGMNAAGDIAGMLPFLMMSDERVKENIEPVGEMYDEQPIYRYNYVGDPVTRIGLLAQDVEDVEPDAVWEVAPDLLAIDYKRATDYAASLGRYV